LRWHYFRTARWLTTNRPVRIGGNCSVRLLSSADANRLADEIRRLSLSARHGGPNNFYYRRASALADRVVVELYGSGQSNPEFLARQADVAEATVIASLVLSGTRANFLRRAAGEQRPYQDLYVLQAGRRARLSSTSRSERTPLGVVLTAADITRFSENGFPVIHKSRAQTRSWRPASGGHSGGSLSRGWIRRPQRRS
jgi:hypothetical protein